MRERESGSNITHSWSRIERKPKQPSGSVQALQCSGLAFLPYVSSGSVPVMLSTEVVAADSPFNLALRCCLNTSCSSRTYFLECASIHSFPPGGEGEVIEQVRAQECQERNVSCH